MDVRGDDATDGCFVCVCRGLGSGFAAPHLADGIWEEDQEVESCV